MNTAAALGVNANVYVGFDIFSDRTGNSLAYAILGRVTGGKGFYSINPVTGAASLVGHFAADLP